MESVIDFFFNSGSTHTLLTPLDLVKCRLQVNQAKYKNLITGFKVTLAEDGSRGLAKGWAPTAFGYSAQVIFFSFNDILYKIYAYTMYDSCCIYQTSIM